MLKHTLYAITIGLIVFFLYLMQYTGAFKSVTVTIDQRGPYTVVYKNFTGPYHKIVATIQEVEKWAQSQKLKCRLSFGEYFDDPRQVEEGRLKSRGGCVIDTASDEEKAVFEKIKTELPADFKIDTLNPGRSVVASFNGAPGIGPMKVYPKAEDYLRDNHLKPKGSVIEIYEIFEHNMMQTIYLWPLEN